MAEENKEWGKFQRIFKLKTVVAYTDLIAAAASQTVAVGTLPADAVVIGKYANLTEVFTDAGSISALKLNLGYSGNTDAFIDDLELLSGPPAAGMRSGLAGDATAQAVTGSLAVTATFTATGANLGDAADTALDAGSVEVGVLYTRIPA